MRRGDALAGSRSGSTANRALTCNARIGTRELKAYCAVDKGTMEMSKMALTELKLSARAYGRILKEARTIADLVGSSE
jgi:magnesium chelatase family protein